MLRLTPGTSMTFIGDQPIIVSRSRHALYELNQIAGYIACRLEDGVTLPQLAQEVADRDGPAPAILEKVLADWSHSGLVHATVAPPSAAPILRQSVSLGRRAFTLRYHDEALVRHVAPLFAHLQANAATGPFSGTVYHLWQSNGLCLFSRDAGHAAVLRLNQAATLVKAQIIQDIIDGPSWSLALHAGCVSRGRKALLLTGPPGAGKTTLISWLIGSGFAYHGDDISMLGTDGRVMGLPFLPTIKSGAWPMMASRYPGQLQSMIHWRPDGRRVRYLTVPSPAAGQSPLSVRWIVKLRRTKGASAQLIPQHPSVLIKHLLSEAASSTGEAEPAAIDGLIHVVGTARTCELEYDDLDEATALLGEFCGPA